MLQFWAHVIDVDPFDPTKWEKRPPCRVYAADGDRFALVDEMFYPEIVTTRDTHPHRYGKLIARRWNIKPTHKKRNGKKLYFVSNSGWRQGRAIFLHVLVMQLSGILPPSKKHKLVNHKDGDEWNCQLDNLEWSTHVKNRRQSKQKYNPGAPL